MGRFLAVTCAFTMIVLFHRLLQGWLSTRRAVRRSLLRRKFVNIADAKARLPELVERASHGEEILIARNGVPQARLMPLASLIPRTPGRGAGKWQFHGDFDAPPSPDLQAGVDEPQHEAQAGG